jgi:DNA-binding MarR family transcriptional regulator
MKHEPVRMERMLGALLRIPFQAINARIARNLAAAGYTDLRPAQFSVFQHLPREGARLTDLAERAQMTKQSMGALVGHLEAGGYLERVPDPVDGRAQIIRRTDRGWAVERLARASIQALEEEWGQWLGKERLQHCRAFLSDLAALLEQ